MSVERLVLLTSVFWALSANRAFLGAALQGRAASELSTWAFAFAMFAILVAGHALIVGLVAQRWSVKPLLTVLLFATAFASYYMGAFGVYLDPTMLRNVLRTDASEARELLNAELLVHVLLYAGLPVALLWQVRLAAPGGRAWWRPVLARATMIVGALAVLIATLLLVFQSFSSLMRNHKEVRYLATPANYLWSLATVAVEATRGAAQPRRAIGLDAAPGSSWAGRKKPLVVVLVVGETARAANWGLNGYARQTTPELAREMQAPGSALVNFPRVASCGTNTEVSLPCMFAPVGRRDYDEARIRGQESLLHVAARAGVAVQWRDNQSGCKGVCEGLPNDTVAPATSPGLCNDGRCLDEGLFADLGQRLEHASGTQLWVLHMLGNHGPSYFRRYPPAFAQFTPECREDDLRKCTPAQITNAYDNAILYTDHLLASAIAVLKANSAKVDSALVYVSDHGESLGENGLFLHGVPYAIAPDVQTRVPMVTWHSPGFEPAVGLVSDCLRASLQRRAAGPIAHDQLFHTVLGLLDVRTALREPALDLTADCRVAEGGGR